jgi:ATP/maltotriose-dependent transcriptional regulator MalT
MHAGPIVWYRATPASADVAALATGLEQSFTDVIGPVGDRLNERLRTTPDPEGDARDLARLLAQNISALRADATLVIDDYQHIGESQAAERFVSAFFERTAMPLLITTRIRPSWVAAKDLLYGEVLELGRNVLAMTHDEAEKLLSQGRSHRGLSGLVALAEGWPAVIGLAALLPEPVELAMQAIPDSLHSYFAEELYQGMPGELQWHVAQLSLAPAITVGLARELFGSSGMTVLDEGHKRGFLTREAGGEAKAYELHPLLRQFLRRKMDEFAESQIQQSAERIGHWYLDANDWDAAFALASEFAAKDLLLRLIERGIDPILAEGRLSTVDQWLELGRRLAPADPTVRLAEVEATFRRGKWRDAETKAIRLADDLPEGHRFGGRLLLRAGQIAQLDDRQNEALELLTRASRRAQSPADVRRALWGRFITLADLEESALAWETLVELEQLPPATIEDLVRASHGRLHWAIRWGGIQAELDRQGGSLQLIEQVPDPVVRTGFLQTYATALGLAAKYGDALEISERQLREAESSALEWVRPHALEIKSLAQLGLRDFDAALSTLRDAYSLASAQGNLHSQMSSVLLTARVFLSRGEQDRAKQALLVDWDRKASTGMEGEYLATKALALACCGDTQDALQHVDASEAITDQIDGRVLRSFVRAIIAHRKGAADADVLLERSIREACSTGNLDAFVSAYRAQPSLLERVRTLESADITGIRRVVCVTDAQLAEKAGFQNPRRPIHGDAELLTPREHDVF